MISLAHDAPIETEGPVGPKGGSRFGTLVPMGGRVSVVGRTDTLLSTIPGS